MKRVVITGAGIVSSIGNNKTEVTESLRDGRSGIKFNPEYKALGLRYHVDGPIFIDQQMMIERKLLRFMGDAAAYGYIAMQEAIDDARLTDSQMSNPETGIKAVFGDELPAVSSTKSLTGHTLGAAGANEAIYSLLMMKEGFITASANITTLDPSADGLPIVRGNTADAELNTVMTNSFGFGGTNSTFVFRCI